MCRSFDKTAARAAILAGAALLFSAIFPVPSAMADKERNDDGPQASKAANDKRDAHTVPRSRSENMSAPQRRPQRSHLVAQASSGKKKDDSQDDQRKANEKRDAERRNTEIRELQRKNIERKVIERKPGGTQEIQKRTIDRNELEKRAIEKRDKVKDFSPPPQGIRRNDGALSTDRGTSKPTTRGPKTSTGDMDQQIKSLDGRQRFDANKIKGNLDNKGGGSDTGKRNDGKNTGSPFSNDIRKSDTGRKMDKIPESTIGKQPPFSGGGTTSNLDRTRATDVRKRLGGKGSDGLMVPGSRKESDVFKGKGDLKDVGKDTGMVIKRDGDRKGLTDVKPPVTVKKGDGQIGATGVVTPPVTVKKGDGHQGLTDRKPPVTVKDGDDRKGFTGIVPPHPGDHKQPSDIGRKLDPGDPKHLTHGPRLGQGHLPQHGVAPKQFPDRAKGGDFDHVVAGATAKKLKIHDQYKIWKDGDVARRLNLEKHADFHRPHHDIHGVHANNVIFTTGLYAHRANFYFGTAISPVYVTHCVPYTYWGPAFFSGVCWYPRWTPWVEWGWYYRCNPYWDPRPLWCRPVLYDPSPAWVYWDVPVWRPLPVASCGTWVDVKPIIVESKKTDLELLAVRFVDPGHPDEKLGPRYRVWFRNNSDEPLLQPFNVVLFAGNDENLRADLPHAGVRVKSMEANDVQSVDIRLPFDVLSMGRDAEGKPAPFAILHVLVDANREVEETTRADNGARLAPADVFPVDPAAFELEPAVASPGKEVLLAGEGLGPQPGQILVIVNGQELEAEVIGWYDLGVRFTLPEVALAGPTDAEVLVVRGDGAATNPLQMKLDP